jgi:predicted NodU family carbamoyl transferase
MQVILGINAFHPDSSACLLIDGKLVAAISEERLGRRIKHDRSFPINSINFLLDSFGIKPSDIDALAIGFNKNKNLYQKALYVLKNPNYLNDLPRYFFKRSADTKDPMYPQPPVTSIFSFINYHPYFLCKIWKKNKIKICKKTIASQKKLKKLNQWF